MIMFPTIEKADYTGHLYSIIQVAELDDSAS